MMNKDELLEQWSTYRIDLEPERDLGFTRSVMAKIQTPSTGRQVRDEAPGRLKLLALTSACTAAGIGKFLLLLHLSI